MSVLTAGRVRVPGRRRLRKAAVIGFAVGFAIVYVTTVLLAGLITGAASGADNSTRPAGVHETEGD